MAAGAHVPLGGPEEPPRDDREDEPDPYPEHIIVAGLEEHGCAETVTGPEGVRADGGKTECSELVFEYTTVDDRRRRVQIIPDTSGQEGWRIESEHTGVSWREVGREPISNVKIDTKSAE